MQVFGCSVPSMFCVHQPGMCNVSQAPQRWAVFRFNVYLSRFWAMRLTWTISLMCWWNLRHESGVTPQSCAEIWIGIGVSFLLYKLETGKADQSTVCLLNPIHTYYTLIFMDSPQQDATLWKVVVLGLSCTGAFDVDVDDACVWCCTGYPTLHSQRQG